MAIKIKKKHKHDNPEPPQDHDADPGYVEVGQGDYCVMTINRHDGSVVVHRFQTVEEAQAQHERNIAADKPLVGVTDPN